MAGLVASLVESSPNRLRYLIADNGGSTLFPSTMTIANGTLLADAIDGSPMHALVSTPVADQAAARKLLMGEGLTSPADIVTPRAHMTMTPRTVAAGQEPWGVDAVVAATAVGVSLRGPADSGALAYLDIEFAPALLR